MPALRMLGLVVLAVFAVSIGILGYVYIRAALGESAARNAALKVVDACGTVIASGSGSTQNVEINIPGNYRMRFLDNQIAVDGYRVPDRGFELRFAENAPELGPGTHRLSISISGGRLVVARIS